MKLVVWFLLLALPASAQDVTVIRILRPAVLKEAAAAMKAAPETVTASHSPRSTGGPHDFFSEGDYWWPNPASADSPYIQKDGQTNSDNFVQHRLAMIRFSRIMGALGSASMRSS